NAADFFIPGIVNSYGTGIVMARDAGGALMGNYGALAGGSTVAGLHLFGLNFNPNALPTPIDLPAGNWGLFFASVNSGGVGTPMLRAQQMMVSGETGLRFRQEGAFGSNAVVNDMLNRDNWPAWLVFSNVHGAVNINPAANPAGSSGIMRTAAPDGGGRPAAEVLNTVWAYLQTLPAADIRRADLVRGNTLTDLAAAMGLTGTAATAFVNEVRTYDAAVRTALGAGIAWNDPSWDPLAQTTHPNHRAGQTPGKNPGANAANANANLIRFLNDADQDAAGNVGTTSGPFWAVRVYPAAWDSSGGVATDVWGRVLTARFPATSGGSTGMSGGFNADYILNAAAVIQNLYATGAVANRQFFAYAYQGGSSVSIQATAGVIAGRHAARDILGVPHSFQTSVPGFQDADGSF
ncbi:MAG: FAD-binding protein, partial [Treponema sp.]|nr:FAD-binding protein [Treponema sp.]